MTGNVLIVDPCIETGRLLKQFLAMDGHDVRFAQTPKQAMAQMMAHPSTVVMIDQDIVGVTTGELLPALRLLAPYRDNLFRVMFLALAGSAEPLEYHRIGFFDVLRKPLDYEEMERVVDVCIASLSMES